MVHVADGRRAGGRGNGTRLAASSPFHDRCNVMSAATDRPARWAPARNRGFTVLEVMVAIAVVAVLAVIATGQYGRYMERLRVTRAILDMGELEGHLAHFEANNRVLPDALSELGITPPLDPWGRPYQYLNHATAKGKGGFRKDKNIVPINTDYDLYSMGPDGVSVPPLTATPSRDDIVRANDGRFIGSVPDYDP
jgi:general secretion pathway protein G